MGAYLSSPLTEKECEDAENDRLAYGAAAMQGWRVSQEVMLLTRGSMVKKGGKKERDGKRGMRAGTGQCRVGGGLRWTVWSLGERSFHHMTR